MKHSTRASKLSRTSSRDLEEEDIKVAGNSILELTEGILAQTKTACYGRLRLRRILISTFEFENSCTTCVI